MNSITRLNATTPAHPATHAESLPLGTVVGAAALVAFALLCVTTARVLHWRGTAVANAAVVTALHLTFADRAGDHAVEIRDADHSGRLIHVVAPGTNGFLRGVLRGLARARRNEHVGEAPAFTLTRWADGRMTLADPQTDREVPLEVFGPTNSQPFAQLFADDAAAVAAAKDVRP